MCHGNLRPGFKPQGAQALPLFLGQHSPIDRGNAGALANRQGIECHAKRAARTGAQLQVIRNS
ncbi:hypothetical protein GCM10023306_29400 [Novosphingobium ginsenosidimutans]